jgi:hypothetical protein
MEWKWYGMEMEWNGNGMERKWNGTEMERNGNGTEMEWHGKAWKSMEMKWKYGMRINSKTSSFGIV